MARGVGGHTESQEKTNEDGNEDSGDHAEYYEGPSPRPESHIETLIMQRTVEARAVGMVRIILSCQGHSETCQSGPAAVYLVTHQIFALFDGSAVLGRGRTHDRDTPADTRR
jgi:hypothetical protein